MEITNMQVKIYRASLRHIEIVKQLFHSYRQFYSQNSIQQESDSFIYQRLIDDKSIIFIAEVDENQLGFAQLYYSRSSVNLRSELILNDLYVNEHVRNQGIGTKLINACKDFALAESVYVLKLETSSTNNIAKKLYKSLGFEIITDTDFYELHMTAAETTLPILTHTKKVKSHVKFADKTVVITGTSYGLGEAMVKEFYDNGYIVLGCGRSQDKLDILSKRYANCEFNLVDISNQFSVKEWSEYLLEKYGVPQIIINNASIIDRPRQPFIDEDLLHIKQIIEVNLLGTMYVTHAFLPYLCIYPNQSTIVNISSGWARKADIGLAGYCASKFAIEGFTSVIAQENKGVVTAVTLDPGAVATTMLSGSVENEYYVSCPSPQEWAKVAVPYVLNITPEQSNMQLVVPRIN